MPTLAMCVQTVTYFGSTLTSAPSLGLSHTMCTGIVNTSLLLRGRSVTFLVLSVLDSTRVITTTVMASALLLKRTWMNENLPALKT